MASVVNFRVYRDLPKFSCLLHFCVESTKSINFLYKTVQTIYDLSVVIFSESADKECVETTTIIRLVQHCAAMSAIAEASGLSETEIP